ncbi:MAG: ABC transporter ATP-binding protein [Planctomycetes bacterium]|nr:ABC transporter ATP-binding protein [Planctomycetota bacterium]
MPPSDADPVVEVRDLVRTFGRGTRTVRAADGVSLSLARGEALALLGANGSGKSTTIKVVLGLLAPTSGAARVLGGPAGRRDARARTGYVPEEARRLPAVRGRELVELFAAIQGVPRAERRRRVDEALDGVGLAADAARRPVADYSRGMARRVALAAAVVSRPALLVLDEPTSGLDPVGTEQVLALLRGLRDAGTSVLLSTHERGTAEGLCDRAVVLGAGRVRASGRLAELLAGDATPGLLALFRRVERG